MPFEIVWEPHGLYKKYTGCVTGQDVIQSVEATMGDERFDELLYTLNDYLDVTGLDMGASAIDQVVAYALGAHVQRPKGRIAIAATHPLVIGMIQKFSSVQGDGYPIAIFSTLAEARDWASQITGDA